ncbi:unnamed protein product [Clavelina lepadiformis]|uniref:Sin3 histone deacetylase corepressor complex component SDS3 n=1 Tax=Clavelina lepadiformis TaxID=159417 RepID=A0ABP0F6E0_CLALP
MAEVIDYTCFDEDSSRNATKKSIDSCDEDTDDASETDRAKREEATEIKEQMYREKLAQIKQQVSQLHSGTLPEFCRKQKRLDQAHKERQKQVQAYHNYLLSKVEKIYQKEQAAASQEFEAKKIELKESIISELQDKKKHIETEHHTLELTGAFTSSTEIKAVTRKLRRRANEPVPATNEKRRKASPTQINFLLSEEEVLDDLKILNKGKSVVSTQEPFTDHIPGPIHQVECKIDHGKLLYDKRWFHNGQPVYIENYKEGTRISGVIAAITEREIWIRKLSDGSRIRIFISQLHRGKCSIKKRIVQ